MSAPCGCADPVVFGHATCYESVQGLSAIPPAPRTVHRPCWCAACPCGCHRQRGTVTQPAITVPAPGAAMTMREIRAALREQAAMSP